MKISKPLNRSTLAITCVGLLALTTSLSAHANDSDRISQLEKQVQELTRRLSSLEGQRSATANQAQQTTAAPQPEAARVAATPKTAPDVLAKWRGLERGLSPESVRATLGTPIKTVANSAFTYWDYPNQGSVTFHQGRLTGWSEPN